DTHLLRYPRYRALQFAEPECPITEQVKENDQLPASLEYLQGLFDTRGRNVGRDARIQTFLLVRPFFVHFSHSDRVPYTHLLVCTLLWCVLVILRVIPILLVDRP